MALPLAGEMLRQSLCQDTLANMEVRASKGVKGGFQVRDQSAIRRSPQDANSPDDLESSGLSGLSTVSRIDQECGLKLNGQADGGRLARVQIREGKRGLWCGHT